MHSYVKDTKPNIGPPVETIVQFMVVRVYVSPCSLQDIARPGKLTIGLTVSAINWQVATCMWLQAVVKFRRVCCLFSFSWRLPCYLKEDEPHWKSWAESSERQADKFYSWYLLTAPRADHGRICSSVDVSLSGVTLPTKICPLDILQPANQSPFELQSKISKYHSHKGLILCRPNSCRHLKNITLRALPSACGTLQFDWFPWFVLAR